MTLCKDYDSHQDYLRIQNDINLYNKVPEDWTNELVFRDWTDLDCEYFLEHLCYHHLIIKEYVPRRIYV